LNKLKNVVGLKTINLYKYANTKGSNLGYDFEVRLAVFYIQITKHLASGSYCVLDLMFSEISAEDFV
jgi:hypothetical protein